MSTSRCPITGQPLPDGYYLHPSTRPRVEDLGRVIRFIPYAAEDVARGEVRPGARYSGRVSRRATILLNTRVYDDVQDMLDALTTWQTELNCHLHTSTTSWDELGTTITRRADQILRWRHAPTMIDELEYTLKRCEHLASPPRARVYVTCPQCQQGGYYRKGRTTVTCVHCEHSIEVRDRQATMWENALYMWLPKHYALQVVSITTGREPTRSQLNHWERDGLVTSIGRAGLYQPNEIITAMRAKRPYRKRGAPEGT